jgi:hypothetical protein
MSESGSDPKNPQKNHKEQHPFKLEKMGKDDLLAILGGVVSSASGSESSTELPPEKTAKAQAEAPVRQVAETSVKASFETQAEPVPQAKVESSPEPVVQAPVEVSEVPVETPVKPLIKPAALHSAEFIKAPMPGAPPVFVKPTADASLTDKPDAVSESLDEIQEDVRVSEMKPPIQAETPKNREIEPVAVRVPPVAPPEPVETPKEEILQVKEALPVPPSVEEVTTPVAPPKPIEKSAPSPEKTPFQLPPSLTPPGMGSMFPKNSSVGTDPLGLFNATTLSSKAIPSIESQSAKPQTEAHVSGMPGLDLKNQGMLGLKPSTPQNDPLHLFDGPPPASFEKPLVGPKPPVDLSHLAEPKTIENDPLHLLDKVVSPANERSAIPGLPPITSAPAMPVISEMGSGPMAPLPDTEAWKSTLTKPPAVSRPYVPPLPKEDELKKASFLQRKLKPLAEISKIPVWVWETLLAVVLLGGLTIVAMLFHKPSYQLIDHLEALCPIRTDVKQIVELDITAFIDIEGKVKQMGFAPLVQLSVSEIPAPNLFAVYSDPGHPQNKTYAIILKVPGSNMPRLSFVNILSNGTWLSTNGWASKTQELEKLSSESAPNEDPAALWVHHQRRLEQALQTGVTASSVSERRFICALSDHLRWYMALKDIPAYKADFSSWF